MRGRALLRRHRTLALPGVPTRTRALAAADYAKRAPPAPARSPKTRTRVRKISRMRAQARTHARTHRHARTHDLVPRSCRLAAGRRAGSTRQVPAQAGPRRRRPRPTARPRGASARRAPEPKSCRDAGTGGRCPPRNHPPAPAPRHAPRPPPCRRRPSDPRPPPGRSRPLPALSFAVASTALSPNLPSQSATNLRLVRGRVCSGLSGSVLGRSRRQRSGNSGQGAGWGAVGRR